jgi:hypothetical protein
MIIPMEPPQDTAPDLGELWREQIKYNENENDEED